MKNIFKRYLVILLGIYFFTSVSFIKPAPKYSGYIEDLKKEFIAIKNADELIKKLNTESIVFWDEGYRPTVFELLVSIAKTDCVSVILDKIYEFNCNKERIKNLFLKNNNRYRTIFAAFIRQVYFASIKSDFIYSEKDFKDLFPKFLKIFEKYLKANDLIKIFFINKDYGYEYQKEQRVKSPFIFRAIPATINYHILLSYHYSSKAVALDINEFYKSIISSIYNLLTKERILGNEELTKRYFFDYLYVDSLDDAILTKESEYDKNYQMCDYSSVDEWIGGVKKYILSQKEYAINYIKKDIPDTLKYSNDPVDSLIKYISSADKSAQNYKSIAKDNIFNENFISIVKKIFENIDEYKAACEFCLGVMARSDLKYALKLRECKDYENISNNILDNFEEFSNIYKINILRFFARLLIYKKNKSESDLKLIEKFKNIFLKNSDLLNFYLLDSFFISFFENLFPETYFQEIMLKNIDEYLDKPTDNFYKKKCFRTLNTLYNDKNWYEKIYTNTNEKFIEIIFEKFAKKLDQVDEDLKTIFKNLLYNYIEQQLFISSKVLAYIKEFNLLDNFYDKNIIVKDEDVFNNEKIEHLTESQFEKILDEMLKTKNIYSQDNIKKLMTYIQVILNPNKNYILSKALKDKIRDLSLNNPDLYYYTEHIVKRFSEKYPEEGVYFKEQMLENRDAYIAKRKDDSFEKLQSIDIQKEVWEYLKFLEKEFNNSEEQQKKNSDFTSILFNNVDIFTEDIFLKYIEILDGFRDKKKKFYFVFNYNLNVFVEKLCETSFFDNASKEVVYKILEYVESTFFSRESLDQIKDIKKRSRNILEILFEKKGDVIITKLKEDLDSNNWDFKKRAISAVNFLIRMYCDPAIIANLKNLIKKLQEHEIGINVLDEIISLNKEFGDLFFDGLIYTQSNKEVTYNPKLIDDILKKSEELIDGDKESAITLLYLLLPFSIRIYTELKGNIVLDAKMQYKDRFNNIIEKANPSKDKMVSYLSIRITALKPKISKSDISGKREERRP
ncbi:hypothetical protein KJ644_00320 [Candidatus Dependentiae bacterium]|nr:hypothetical protein [Candidatus Dependentiae bacterium]MBU4386904.1 hypothetical protein [Candidatus Dependentiae bacterium]MCG2756380.1 hypothetical protein [Candidatus Dependentiae bacterium]